MCRDRKNREFFAIFFCGLFIFCLTLPGCVSQDAPTPEEGHYRVINVIDGDTIELTGGRRVRYIGIDAPETMKRAGSGWIFHPEPYGVRAKERNSEMVANKDVFLEFDRETQDRYGRWLAYVYVDDVMVNIELVKEGLATVYTFPPNTRHYRGLLRAQKEAIYNNRAIWANIRSISPEKAVDNTGNFLSVKGIVSKVKMFGGRIDIYIGDSEGLRAYIYRDNAELFVNEGIDVETHYPGKYVEVTGKVEDRRGPSMRIDNPTQIRVL